MDQPSLKIADLSQFDDENSVAQWKVDGKVFMGLVRKIKIEANGNSVLNFKVQLIWSLRIYGTTDPVPFAKSLQRSLEISFTDPGPAEYANNEVRIRCAEGCLTITNDPRQQELLHELLAKYKEQGN